MNLSLLGATVVSSGPTFIMVLMYVVVLAAAIAGLWRTFEKAGQPGWAAIVPIYNAYILLKVAQRPGWWLLLFLIPIVNVVVALMVSLDTAKAFGKSALFGVFGLWIFSVIGFLMLGFGDATYGGDAPTSATAPVAPTAV